LEISCHCGRGVFRIGCISQSAFAQIKVMTSGGFAAPLREALPEFEKSTGIPVEVILGKSQGSGSDTHLESRVLTIP
jgi:ABC-type molybdate transport system substrate-binding protein